MEPTTFEREKRLLKEGFLSVGIDEAGRGPLAGPVVACAALLKDFEDADQKFEGKESDWKLVRDSKKLSPKQREKAFTFVEEQFHLGLGIIGPETIDRVNILQATYLAMKSALSDLLRRLPSSYKSKSLYLLLDGNQEIPNISHSQEAIIDGDAKVRSIAAASIVAKVTRDRIIVELDEQYPGYGLASHKGYGTKAHFDALRRLGPSPIHRMSFDPVKLSIPENVNRKLATLAKKRKGW